MPSLILGIDFGGTKNAVALQTQGAPQWLDYRRQISLPGATAQSDLEAVIDWSHQLLEIYSGELLALGVSFGGPVDFESGIVRQSYHVPGWENFALREHLQKEFDVPVIIDNDANAGALGEWSFGAGQNCRSLFYLTVSTGIGGGWILEGQPYRGADGLAGEIGHLLIDPNGPVCACGKKGCLEALACGPAIARRAVFRMETESGSGKTLYRLCNADPKLVTAEMVSRAASEGDQLAQEVLQEAARFLGTGIGQALALMNPERIVLGGGVTKAGEAYWAEVRRSARENAIPGSSIDILPARLNDDAPLWGAIALANEFLRRQR